ncbi:MAG TPA: 2-hydroxyhepta-2,4-diene-1,7-dioate isomerase [Algoriphagus sp.]|jgi:2-keto-4-pentenoate hydratase/2-oxohepta-3-ene-1,7-dioic acid hydratase in catechol pathway|uniref:fumarylacetoacetate hydrolase family protein n=2 Tax=Algoriphagus TaxID=246875 RepID=UPI000C65DBEF|nr:MULTISPECIES: fumarylacetoacetate hydrolase family protein [unclassified Algoriphagus]MAL13190.1 2-hydroxyhepta-2,4-diene-1,7-dioate isomerase [Algoriphagus sp.]MAN86140.1 2-hydroxyhepta-2,4-diene-1,7-dioate isomerase [Algoriphagus sp.]QYH38208.1 fumarylacetoacetate hydrolase family protein [Algoriphagus sp. NBT04N3]HAH38721.1 2-hydroxyhepta-2,4-diene-1,7-dioate isomerase [Algoriphagus sp.]HCB46829.1 2-hydroxyhepta-2,4-diene-1,7-dioate isomerase [Algoriphagus sp.]|tara:strand:- start:6057 stop:6668 length:612 start_codon:yes stop_codon:yes gene_type:complete
MKIICIGRNYAAHIEELKNETPGNPVVFLKPDTALLKNGAAFYYPDFSKNIHHEAELVLKINKEGKYIQKKFAHRYYEEIGLGIDFTARDLQDQCKAKGLPWEIAKAFNGSAPIGDFIPVSEIENLQSIDFHLSINGEIKQQGNTSLMLFNFDTIIEYVSQFFTLKKGDLIYTGTPAGVGPVKIGDRLEGFIGTQKMLDFEVK